jgi:hypothetical protein
VVNEEIRALLLQRGGWLKPDDRAVYEGLRAEWAAAVQDEVIEAA